MLIVYTDQCVETRLSRKQVEFRTSEERLLEITEWDAAEELPNVVFLMERGASQGRMMYIDHRDQFISVYKEAMNEKVLIINHASRRDA